MSDSAGSLIRHAAIAACLTFLFALPSHAQQPTDAPASPAFMSRYDFHLSAAALDSGDDRFSWDTHFGGDLDVVDYVAGRVFVGIDYQAVLGSEFRPFDPNQGNYELETGASGRIAGVEIMGLFHHISRHLSDRPKRFAIAWNDADVIALKRFSLDDTTVDVRAAAGKIVAKSFVDYGWTADLDLKVTRRINPHVAVYGRAFGNTFGIDAEVSDRPQQRGGRLEGGVRLTGTNGAIELFGGYERVVDADPIERLRQAWTFAGFRIVNK
jgi:hypothetical protein